MSSAARTRRGSSPAHRVASRDMSWFEPVHAGHAPGGSSASMSLDDVAHRRGLERRGDEREVEREVQLVEVGAVERGERRGVVDRCLAEQEPRWVVASRRSSRQRRSTSCTSGRFALYTGRWPKSCASSGSSAVAGGLSRSSASLTIMLHTSMRKPSTPRSNQNRMMSSNVSRTSSFHQFRSGCSRRWLCR